MKLELVLKPSYITKYYSCDYLTPKEWEEETNPNFLLGSIYITIGTFVMILYIPILYVLLTKDLLKNNFYKLILCITIVDIAGLSMSSWACGIFTIKGYVYCSQPVAIYTVAIVVLTTWCTNSILAIVLAFNRCLDAFNLKWANAIFSGKKIYFWIITAFLFGLGIGLFTPPMLYSAKQYTVFFDPYLDIDRVRVTFENPDQYNNFLVVLDNVGIFVVLPSLYFGFSILMLRKIKTSTHKMSRMKKSLLLQSFLLSSITFCSALTYDLMQFFILNRAIVIIGHFFWLCSTCVGAFVYLTFNITIRNHIIEDFVPASIKKYWNIKSKVKIVKFQFPVKIPTI
uniref:Serpentine Receptor, class T n=1 Tax=Rhabditophanes sp. KR3021 TaxID=114890 RepID=A0AC35UDT3_9BILA